MYSIKIHWPTCSKPSKDQILTGSSPGLIATRVWSWSWYLWATYFSEVKFGSRKDFLGEKDFLEDWWDDGCNSGFANAGLKSIFTFECIVWSVI